MKPLPIILVLLGVVALLSFLQWKGCQSRKAAQTRAVVAEGNAVRWKAYGDSAYLRSDSTVRKAKADSLFYAHRDDSLLKHFAKADTAVNHTRATIGALVAVGDAAAERKDTATQLSSCKELRDSLKIASGVVSDLQTSAETLNKAYGDEVQQLYGTINSLAGNIVALRTAKDSLAAIAIDQARRNIKLASTPAKRWGIGIGAGYVVGPKGGGPGVSITAHYDIIRF